MLGRHIITLVNILSIGQYTLDTWANGFGLCGFTYMQIFSNTYYSAKQFAVGWIKRCIAQIRKAHCKVIYIFPTRQRISAPNPLTVQESIMNSKTSKELTQNVPLETNISGITTYTANYHYYSIKWDSCIYFPITLYVLMMSEFQS